jgi:hypothetical protein
MKNILYKITYLPHLNTNYPKYYIGSKYKYTGNYFGSIASNQSFEYTNGLKLKDWWKLKQKENIHDFSFEIIKEFDANITPKQLVEEESKLHIQLDILNDEYFNQSIATKGFCSTKNTDETKLKKSLKTKEFWNSNNGKLKKQKLIERNKTQHKQKMIERWKNPTDKMKNRPLSGRPKGAKDLTKRKKSSKIKKILANGIIFNDAYEASKHFGIHPVNVRRRCRLNYENTWSYIDESCDNNGYTLGSKK